MESFKKEGWKENKADFSFHFPLPKEDRNLSPAGPEEERYTQVLILQNEQVVLGLHCFGWLHLPLATMLEVCHVCGASAEQGGHRNTQVVVQS